MNRDQNNWKPTNLIVIYRGAYRVDESAKSLEMNNKERCAISRRAEHIIDNAEAIVKNDKGELALLFENSYYPLQIGEWIVKDFTIWGNFDTEEREIRYYDIPCNACLPFNGLNFLLGVGDKDK